MKADVPRIGALSQHALSTALKGPGLRFQTGPLVVGLHTRLPELTAPLLRLYAHHPLRGPQDFVDFHVHLRPADGLRRWVRPQVDFAFDGMRPFQPLPRSNALAMLEWGLNWCVAAHCHQYLVVHAACLARGDNAVVLPAPPGSGKSTLCAALMLAGWRLLSDELTLLHPATGQAHALARPINLKNESIDLIACHAPHSRFGPQIRDTQKGRVAHLAPTALSVSHMHQPARVRWVVLPRYQAHAPPTIEALPKPTAFLRLAENAFNYDTLGRTGFTLIGDVVDHATCCTFTYSALADAQHFFDELARE